MKSVTPFIKGSRSIRPSRLVMPSGHFESIVAFLTSRFTHISREAWVARCQAGDVYLESGEKVTEFTPYRPNAVLFYHRWLAEEARIPVDIDIVFEDDEIVVVNKPAFLPVSIGGQYINETVCERLRANGYPEIEAAHRLDRMTSGLLLLTKNASCRAYYQQLFATRQIEKRYSAVTELSARETIPQQLNIRNRLRRPRGSVVVESVDGEVNAITECTLVNRSQRYGVWEVNLKTGFMHQIRCHLAGENLPIVNDDFYPVLKPPSENRYNSPLMLRSIGLRFRKNNSDQMYSFDLPHLELPL